MGIRCLLGHDFGDAEVEREREEDGNEMVVTIQEVKTCTRCEERRIVSENKEITSIRAPEDVDPDDAAGTDEDSHSETTDEDLPSEATDEDETEEPTHPAVAGDEEFEPSDDPDEDDGVILDSDPAEREPGEWPDAGRPQSDATPMQNEAGDVEDESTASKSADDSDSASGATADDDGARTAAGEDSTADTGEPAPAEGESEDVEFIGGAETASADGDEGSAAETTESEDRETGEWPEHRGEDEGFDAEPGGAEDVTFSGNGLTPEVHGDDPGEDAEYIDADATGARANRGTASTPDASSDIAREASAPVERSAANGDTEFYCPNCELTRSAGGSSMRSGDICPECRKGYLTERGA